MDHVASYRLTLFAVKAQQRAYSRSTFTAQSPPYCASPLPQAAPGARTAHIRPWGPPPRAPHLRTVPCFFIVLWIASVQQRATSPPLFEFGLHARRPLHLRVEHPRSLLRLVCITGVFYIKLYSRLPIWILRQFFLCLIHAYGSPSSGLHRHICRACSSLRSEGFLPPAVSLGFLLNCLLYLLYM